MISRIVSSIAVLLVVLVSSAAAFSTQQHSSIGKTRQSQLQTPTICFAEVDESNSDDATNDEPKVAVKCPGCDLCDGSGRILGGIAVVLPWWPIKAYRPCPNFIERGGQYSRVGQGLDEIAFGRDSTFTPDQ